MIVLDTEHYILESVRDEDGEPDGFVASCRHCDWHSAAGPSDDVEEETRLHLAEQHPEPKDKPEDVAKVELDEGLEGIGYASQVPPDHRSFAQAQAQLHLLASIATSLYELRTRGMQLYELLAVPKVMTTTKGMDESIRRGLENVAEGRIQADDDITAMSDDEMDPPVCLACHHPLYFHGEFSRLCTVIVDGVQCPCAAGTKP